MQPIIIEGPDGSGKTSIALAIAAKTGRRYIRCPGSTYSGEALRDLLKSGKTIDPTVLTLLFAAVDYDVAILAQEDDGNFVIDRSGISGIIYRLASGNRNNVNILKQLIYRDIRFLYPKNGCVVRLDASDTVLDERMGLRGDDKDLGTLLKKEVRRIYRTMPEIVHVVYTGSKPIEAHVDEVIGWSKWAANQSTCLVRWVDDL